MAELKAKVVVTPNRITETMGVSARALQYSRITKEETLAAAQRNSNVPLSFLSMTYDAIVKEIQNFVMSGHPVQLPVIGLIRPGLRTTCQEVAGKTIDQMMAVLSEQVDKVKFSFVPSSSVKNQLKRMKYTIRKDVNLFPSAPAITFPDDEPNIFPDPANVTEISLGIGDSEIGYFETNPRPFMYPVKRQVSRNRMEDVVCVKFESSDPSIMKTEIISDGTLHARKKLKATGVSHGTAVLTLKVGYGKIWSAVQWNAICE